MRIPATLAVTEVHGLTEGTTFIGRDGEERVTVSGSINVQLQGSVPKRVWDELRGMPVVRAVNSMDVFGDVRTDPIPLDLRASVTIPLASEREEARAIRQADRDQTTQWETVRDSRGRERVRPVRPNRRRTRYEHTTDDAGNPIRVRVPVDPTADTTPAEAVRADMARVRANDRTRERLTPFRVRLTPEQEEAQRRAEVLDRYPNIELRTAEEILADARNERSRLLGDIAWGNQTVQGADGTVRNVPITTDDRLRILQRVRELEETHPGILAGTVTPTHAERTQYEADRGYSDAYNAERNGRISEAATAEITDAKDWRGWGAPRQKVVRPRERRLCEDGKYRMVFLSDAEIAERAARAKGIPPARARRQFPTEAAQPARRIRL